MTRNRSRPTSRSLWYRLTLWQQVILVIAALALILVAVLFLLTVWANPNSVSSIANSFILVGIVTLAVVTIIGSLVVPLAFRLGEEHATHKRSEKALSNETENSERELKPKLRGIHQVVHRRETEQIIQQLELGRPVLLTGEAGIGKSGIGVALVDEVRRRNAFPLLLDARHVLNAGDSTDLRSYFDIDEPLDEVIERLGRAKRLYLLLDQLDNIVGAPSCRILVNFVIQCAKCDGVNAVVISRHRETNEQGALRPLLEAGFQEVICRPLDIETIRRILEEVGIRQIAPELLRLASNLLNLELICEIVRDRGNDGLGPLQDEIELWERYVTTLQEREERAPNLPARDLLMEAARLAKVGLACPDRSFVMDDPPTAAQNRLVSNYIVVRSSDSGFRYRFAHEKLQDYLYARHASRLGLSVSQVYEEIDRLHARNVLIWMLELYSRSNAPQYEPFFEELLSG